ncbi:MAG: site-specific integrase [Oscillospiraceae bacterium]|nr:site-specific integrase [Oscillospiraceae bacterium]
MAKKRAKGEGLLRQRSNGLWEARVMTGYKTRSVYAKTQEEVIKKRDKLLQELKSGINVDDNITAGDWLLVWLKDYKLGFVKQKSYQGYEINVRVHLLPSLKKIKLRELRRYHVQQLLNDKTKAGLSTNTVSYIRRTLHNALNQAVINELVPHNVASGVKVQSGKKKERRILTLHEQEALLQALKGEDRGFMVELALFTGLRCGELLGLRWRDFDKHAKTITVRQTVQRLYGENGKTSLVIVDTPKTETSHRTIPLLGDLADRLHRHRKRQLKMRECAGDNWIEHDLLFATEIGTPIDSSNFSSFLSSMSAKAGIDRVNIHALRHAFATRALEQGIELKVVSEILGHSGIQITADIYSHVSLEHKKDQMQKMNKLLTNKGGKKPCLKKKS